MTAEYSTGLVDFFLKNPNKLFGKIFGDDGLGLVFFHLSNRVCAKDINRLPCHADIMVFGTKRGQQGLRAEWWAFEDEFKLEELPFYPELQRRREAELVNLMNIHSNLGRFGVEDLEVIGEAGTVSGQTVRTSTCRVTGLMSKYAHDLFDTTTRDPIDSIYFSVYQNEKYIGTIDRELRFHFEGAPDLATFLSYAVASDGGREREINAFHPQSAAQKLLCALLPLKHNKWDDTTDNVYTAFKHCLETRFVYNDTSRFSDRGDSFCYEAWKIAIREKFGEDMQNVDECTNDYSDD